MADHKPHFDALDVQVLCIAYDEISLLERKMMHDMTVPYPLIIDRARGLYRRWGLGRTNVFGAMLKPSLNWRYLKLLLKGERFLGFAPDMFQLGGDFVVDAKGIVRFAHFMTHNGDQADIQQLLNETRRVQPPGE